MLNSIRQSLGPHNQSSSCIWYRQSLLCPWTIHPPTPTPCLGEHSDPPISLTMPSKSLLIPPCHSSSDHLSVSVLLPDLTSSPPHPLSLPWGSPRVLHLQITHTLMNPMLSSLQPGWRLRTPAACFTYISYSRYPTGHPLNFSNAPCPESNFWSSPTHLLLPQSSSCK